MKRIRQTLECGLVILCALCFSMTALAQFPPGGGFPGGGGPPRMGGGGTNDALINAPIEALVVGLKLTSTQKTKIAQIQKAVHRKVDAMMPKPNGGMPDFGKMQASFGKIREIDARETKHIEALLTPAQKNHCPELSRTFRH